MDLSQAILPSYKIWEKVRQGDKNIPQAWGAPKSTGWIGLIESKVFMYFFRRINLAILGILDFSDIPEQFELVFPPHTKVFQKL